MAGIARKTAYIFASDVSPSDNISEWGTLAQGSVEYTNDIAQIQAGSGSQWLNGFLPALIGNRSPTWQDLNGAFLVFSQQIAYVLSRGIPDWDADTTYNTSDMCKLGSVLYYSNADGNVGNEPGVSSQWVNWFGAQVAPNLCAAWVNFDGTTGGSGGNCTVRNALNVARVVRMSQGSYQIVFANALAGADYTFVGSAGTPNGGNPAPGDNNLIMGGPAGAAIMRTVNACNVYCREPTQTPGLEDSSCISVLFFAAAG